MPFVKLVTFRKQKKIIGYKSFFQRATLVILCSVLTLSVAMPNQVMALALFNQKSQPKPTSILPAQNVDITKSQATAESSSNTPNGTTPEPGQKKIDRTVDHEIASKRTAFSSTYVNKDGSKSVQYSKKQLNYEKNGQWQKLDNQIKDVKNPSFFKSDALQIMTGVTPEPDTFTGSAGLLDATMKSLGQGVQVNVNGKTITIKPVGAKDVKPKRKNNDTVIYANAWPGIDLEYTTQGELVKENIVIKDPKAATNLEFEVEGGKVVDDLKHPGFYTVEGMEDGVRFGGLTLALNDRGPIDAKQYLTQSKTNKNGIKVSVDKAWFSSLPKSSFPLTIDPSFGRWDQDGTDWMYKSDGYSCQGNTCWIQAGTLYDNGWKHWRSYFQFPYPELVGKTVLGANIHGYYNPNANPDPNPRYLFMGHANCIGFWCTGRHLATVLTAGDFDVDVTSELQAAVNGGDMGAVWSFWGEEVPYKTYKTYSDMSLWVNYDTPTPQAAPTEPADKQVTINTQPTLRVNPVVDADGDTVQYYYRVSTSPDAETGAVINSGWTTATQWTVPDGILQDGTTYYWHVFTLGAMQTNPNWVRSFKVDLRTGKDSTQAYDTVGPMGIDLATGNATTGTGTHTISALGGSIGLDMNYNSPAKSQKGLTGEYWNVPSGYSFTTTAPTGTPNLTRNDQELNFNWPSGSSPSPGIINNDWFYARWKGYFVAPVTGSYSFGASQDDGANINVNGQDFSGCYGATPCYNGAPVTLQAGQAVPITVSYEEAVADAYFRMYVKGPVAEQIVPRDWLQTEVKATASQYGLSGRYYTDDGSHNFPTNSNDPNRFMMARNDSSLSFNWGLGGPAPGLQADNFMAKWTGYVTVPTTGTYTFGSQSDDGVRVKLNTGLLGTQQTVLDYWQYNSAAVWGNTVDLTAGQQVPITVEYYEATGPSSLQILVRGPGLSDQPIPAKWLTPKAGVLPDAWRLGVDADGNIAYERLRAAGTSVVLEDSTRATHEYTWNGSSYKPPVNEDGQLTHNSDNTYTLIDTDGRTYIFDAEGKLASLTTPTDDRTPASLKYEYSGDPSRLMKITDGVTNTRYGTLHYKGLNEEGNCSTPSGFDAAPDGMLCAFKTSDGNLTKLYYKAGQLSRVEKPGNNLLDYGYDALGRITSIRDGMASDAIAANVRPDDNNLLTEVSYDQLGRVSAIKAPAPTVGANRMNHTFEYLAGATQFHVTGAPEPNGFSKRVEYDSLLRTTKVTDAANLSGVQEWDSVKDLQLSSTDATGLKSTTIYDQLDRSIDAYGPAPAAWFGADRRPTATYASQVPHAQTGYDEGINGLAISVFDNTKLTGVPKLSTTSMNQPGEPAYVLDLTNPTVTPTDGLSIRATGKIRLDQVGTYGFRFYNGGGARLYIDGQLKIDNWAAGNERFSADTTYTNTSPGQYVSIMVEANKAGTSGSGENGRVAAVLQQITPGQSVYTGANMASQLTPAYNLKTSQTAYDAQLGNVTSTTSYAKPEYGLATTTTADPSGLNLQATATFETPGTGFLRQTSKTLPGGSTTNYQHYSANDTRDNPCTVDVEAFHQAGRPKGKVEADPDGAGPLTGRTSETIYDESGNVVATHYNSDPWTCTSYDARGRVTSTTIPTIGTQAGRTITNNYAVGGNPLITSTSDASGTITIENDLLGRTVKYTDAKGNVTTNTYDDYGKLTSRTSPVGTESFGYDQYDRLTTQKLDNVTFATVTYDQYGRVQSVAYPAGLSLSGLGYDDRGHVNSAAYMASGVSITDQVTRSVSGKVISGNENGVTKQYGYDAAGRLTTATIGGNVLTYTFGSPDVSCSGVAGNNPNAGKDSNRMSFTLNGQVTTYCYDNADKLLTSSDVRFTGAQYDDQGNTTSLGDSSHKTSLTYDVSSRNTSMKEMYAGSDTKEVSYERDVSDRLLRRTYKINGAIQADAYYGYTSSSDSPSFTMTAAGVVLQKYITLLGGVNVTIKPQSTSAGMVTYSLSNIHGDTMATVNADGIVTIQHPTGPYGEALPDTTVPTNNLEGASFNYVGRYEKTTDVGLAIAPTQMGARVYIGELGRFMQVDPIEGGTLNNYVYTLDPVDQKDLSGKCIGFAMLFCIAVVAAVSVATAARDLNSNPRSLASWVNMGLAVGGVSAWSVAPRAPTPQARGGENGDFSVARKPVGNRSQPLMSRDQQNTLGNMATRIGGRQYTGHALNSMQNAGIYPSLVENTVRFGLRTGQPNGTTRIYDEFNDVTIVLNSKGDVITTWWGGGIGK